MPKKHTFTAVIQNAGAGGAFVDVPFDVEKNSVRSAPESKR